MAAKSGLGLFLLPISEVMLCCFIFNVFLETQTPSLPSSLVPSVLKNIVHYFIVLYELSPFPLTLTPDHGGLNVSRHALYLGSYLLNVIGQSWL